MQHYTTLPLQLSPTPHFPSSAECSISKSTWIITFSSLHNTLRLFKSLQHSQVAAPCAPVCADPSPKCHTTCSLACWLFGTHHMLWPVQNTHGQPGCHSPIINGQMTTDWHLSHANYSGLWLTFFSLLEVTDSSILHISSSSRWE